jgi:TolB-like protein
MGEVWKARDTRLGRVVAIKRLHGQHGERFEQEARAIAALNHPNICQIHDIGPDYLVLEYIDGKPLQGPIPVEEAVRLAIQITSALEEAHGRGILHRDLKPANILVTSKGTAKLLDFGLAKLTASADATRTIEGTIAGTPSYMAPEQIEGQPCDARSDVFSFGAVLYEMLAGSRAFDGMASVLRDDPKPPPALGSLVLRCLAKQPGQRFQTIAEVKAALELAASSNPGEKTPSIAVLPFANMSRDDDDEYFSDGLAEEIINALTQIAGLKVIARTSAFAFKGKNEDIRKIAEALGVTNVLEGSVRRAGNRLRVTAQLIHAADGTHLWSQRYDRELTDVFAVQDEIAAAIAGALQVKLTGKPTAARPHQPNLPAWESFLKGRHQLYKLSPEGFARAEEYFQHAIALDPQWADPHSSLGGLYFFSATLACAR